MSTVGPEFDAVERSQAFSSMKLEFEDRTMSKPMPGVVVVRRGYLEVNTDTGAKRVVHVRIQAEDNKALPGSRPFARISDIYVRPNGTLFELVVNDAEDTDGKMRASTISRNTNGRDTYLAKGFRWASLADVKRALDAASHGKALMAQREKDRDPAAVQARQAAEVGGAVANALISAGMITAPSAPAAKGGK